MHSPSSRLGFPYSEVDLEDAIDAVEERGVRVSRAARDYGVPRSTLRDRLRKRGWVEKPFQKTAEDLLCTDTSTLVTVKAGAELMNNSTSVLRSNEVIAGGAKERTNSAEDHAGDDIENSGENYCDAHRLGASNDGDSNSRSSISLALDKKLALRPRKRPRIAQPAGTFCDANVRNIAGEAEAQLYMPIIPNNSGGDSHLHSATGMVRGLDHDRIRNRSVEGSSWEVGRRQHQLQSQPHSRPRSRPPPNWPLEPIASKLDPALLTALSVRPSMPLPLKPQIPASSTTLARGSNKDGGGGRTDVGAASVGFSPTLYCTAKPSEFCASQASAEFSVPGPLLLPSSSLFRSCTPTPMMPYSPIPPALTLSTTGPTLAFDAHDPHRSGSSSSPTSVLPSCNSVYLDRDTQAQKNPSVINNSSAAATNLISRSSTPISQVPNLPNELTTETRNQNGETMASVNLSHPAHSSRASTVTATPNTTGRTPTFRNGPNVLAEDRQKVGYDNSEANNANSFAGPVQTTNASIRAPTPFTHPVRPGDLHPLPLLPETPSPFNDKEKDFVECGSGANDGADRQRSLSLYPSRSRNGGAGGPPEGSHTSGRPARRDYHFPTSGPTGSLERLVALPFRAEEEPSPGAVSEFMERKSFSPLSPVPSPILLLSSPTTTTLPSSPTVTSPATPAPPSSSPKPSPNGSVSRSTFSPTSATATTTTTTATNANPFTTLRTTIQSQIRALWKSSTRPKVRSDPDCFETLLGRAMTLMEADVKLRRMERKVERMGRIIAVEGACFGRLDGLNDDGDDDIESDG